MALARQCVCFLVMSFLASVAVSEEPKPQKAESQRYWFFQTSAVFQFLSAK